MSEILDEEFYFFSENSEVCTQYERYENNFNSYRNDLSELQERMNKQHVTIDKIVTVKLNDQLKNSSLFMSKGRNSDMKALTDLVMVYSQMGKEMSNIIMNKISIDKLEFEQKQRLNKDNEENRTDISNIIKNMIGNSPNEDFKHNINIDIEEKIAKKTDLDSNDEFMIAEFNKNKINFAKKNNKIVVLDAITGEEMINYPKERIALMGKIVEKNNGKYFSETGVELINLDIKRKK